MTEFLLTLWIHGNGAAIATTRLPDMQSCMRVGLAFKKEDDYATHFTCVEVKK